MPLNIFLCLSCRRPGQSTAWKISQWQVKKRSRKAESISFNCRFFLIFTIVLCSIKTRSSMDFFCRILAWMYEICLAGIMLVVCKIWGHFCLDSVNGLCWFCHQFLLVIAYTCWYKMLKTFINSKVFYHWTDVRNEREKKRVQHKCGSGI